MIMHLDKRLKPGLLQAFRDVWSPTLHPWVCFIVLFHPCLYITFTIYLCSIVCLPH